MRHTHHQPNIFYLPNPNVDFLLFIHRQPDVQKVVLMSHRPDFHERKDITFIVPALVLWGLEEEQRFWGRVTIANRLSELYYLCLLAQILKAIPSWCLRVFFRGTSNRAHWRLPFLPSKNKHPLAPFEVEPKMLGKKQKISSTSLHFSQCFNPHLSLLSDPSGIPGWHAFYLQPVTGDL